MGTTNLPAGFWIWLDDAIVVNHSAGMLLVSDKQWNGLTDLGRAEYKPVSTRNGLYGRGLVEGDLLLVRLDAISL